MLILPLIFILTLKLPFFFLGQFINFFSLSYHIASICHNFYLWVAQAHAYFPRIGFHFCHPPPQKKDFLVFFFNENFSKQLSD